MSEYIVLSTSYAATPYAGIVRLSSAPTSATIPIALGANDPILGTYLQRVEHDGTMEGLGTVAKPLTLAAQVTLGGIFATNQAFRLQAGIAYPVTSVDITIPYVDGITLESGAVSDVVPAAMAHGVRYRTPLVLPPGNQLYLGQDGRPTATQPSLGAGDVWQVATMRQDDSYNFVLSPSKPILL